MQINSLELHGFRNYVQENIQFDPKCNVIYGENAQGKTNLLEAVFYLSCGKSPRAHNDKELIGFDLQEAKIVGKIQSRDRDFTSEVIISRDKRKKITVNGVKEKKNSSLSDILNVVFFSPEELYLIRDGAAARRRFMDIALCQLKPKYEEALSEYSRIYDHKSRILKDYEEYPHLLDTLPEFNEQMIRSGSILIYYRAAFCERLKEYAGQAHFECSGGKETLSLSYKTVKTIENPLSSLSEIRDGLRKHMDEHYHAEIASKSCLSGPHKDDIEVEVNGRNARQFCSQGQVRTAALSLKLAEREIYKNNFGEYPVILLDDVLSELDPKRQEYVLNRISGGQIFITCCENDRLDSLMTGKVFHISKGEVL